MGEKSPNQVTLFESKRFYCAMDSSSMQSQLAVKK
jgi:hypothetical protein